jgi:hypothetical protein
MTLALEKKWGSLCPNSDELFTLTWVILTVFGAAKERISGHCYVRLLWKWKWQDFGSYTWLREVLARINQETKLLCHIVNVFLVYSFLMFICNTSIFKSCEYFGCIFNAFSHLWKKRYCARHVRLSVCLTVCPWLHLFFDEKMRSLSVSANVADAKLPIRSSHRLVDLLLSPGNQMRLMRDRNRSKYMTGISVLYLLGWSWKLWGSLRTTDYLKPCWGSIICNVLQLQEWTFEWQWMYTWDG